MLEQPKKRNFPKHRYKFGKQIKSIGLAIFKKLLDKVDGLRLKKYSPLQVKSLLVLLFWTGIRKTEAVGSPAKKYILPSCKRHSEPIAKVSESVSGILKEDIWVEGEWLYVKALARKHGSREAPLMLHVSLPYVDLIISQWKETQPKQRVWPITEWDSWDIVKKLDGKKYPHFFRSVRITELCANPKMSVADICNWTGLTPETINAYMERSGRFIRETAEKMKEQYLAMDISEAQ